MTEPITWTTERRKIRDLIPWPRNPRQIKGEQVKRLQESVEEFGQFETIAVGPDNSVYNGHQRLKSWGAKFGPDYEVEVRVSSRQLSEKEREKLTILAHKGAAGEWDFDTLANEFEVSELLEWGFNELELGLKPADDWAAAMDSLPDEDRAPFQQMTFTLHDAQVETVKEALKVAASMGDYGDTQNENGNGNALARICELFLGENERR